MSTTISISPWSLEGYFIRGEKTFPEIVQMVAEMGVDGVDVNEIYMQPSPNPDPALLRSIRRLCESFGLKITSCWFWADLLAGAAMESANAVVAHVERFLASAEILEASSITVTNGHLPPNVPVETARSTLMRIYGKLAPLAENHGIVIGLEAGRVGTPFNSPQGTLDLVKIFDSPYLTVTPDFEAWRRPTEQLGARYVHAQRTEPLSVDVFKACLPFAPFLHAKFP